MHENVGMVNDLAVAMGVGPIDIKILFNSVGIPWKHEEGRDIYSRRHLVQAFKCGLVKTDRPSESAAAHYSLAEAAERYTASLPADDSMPF